MTDEITEPVVPGEVIPASIEAPIGIHQVARITNEETGKLAYLVGYVAPRMQPAIQSAITGNVYAISWKDMIEMGIKLGLDEVKPFMPPSNIIMPGG